MAPDLSYPTSNTTLAPNPHPHSHLSPIPLYRITTAFRPSPHLSEEDFYTHWFTIHGPLCVPWALHYKFVEYTQYVTPQILRSKLLEGKGNSGTIVGSPFEACADFYVADYEDYFAAFRDPYYLEVVKADELNFVGHREAEDDRMAKDDGGSGGEGVGGKLASVRAMTMLGWCRSIIKDGKPVVDVPRQVWNKWDEYQLSVKGN